MDITITFFFYFTSVYHFCRSIVWSIKLLYARVTKEQKLLNTLLFGAGANGLRTKRALDDSNAVNVLAFIDDDPGTFRRSIEGHNRMRLDNKLEKFIENKKVQQVIITTEKVSQKRKTNSFSSLKIKE